MNRYFVPLIILILVTALTASAQDSRVDHWREDIDFLKKELPLRHKNFFTVKPKSVFKDALEDLAEKVETMSDLAIALRLQQVVASFGDSHTSINLSKMLQAEKMLPFLFHFYVNGYYILQSDSTNMSVLGAEVLSINSIPVDTIAEKFKTLITIDNSGSVKKTIPGMLQFVALLKHFIIASGDSIYMDLRRAENGDTVFNYLVVVPDKLPAKEKIVKLKQAKTPMYLENFNPYFRVKHVPENELYYIQYNRCWSRELEVKYNEGKNADSIPTFKEFEAQILNDAKNLQFTKLVFDLRFNAGGSSVQGTELIEKLMSIKRMNDIKIYVFIHRFTYSSAIINAMNLREYKNVVFVGEETSGSPNHFGEVKSFKLPNSGLTVSYSTKYFQLTNVNGHTIIPDVKIQSTIYDYLQGRDAVMEYIFAQ